MVFAQGGSDGAGLVNLASFWSFLGLTFVYVLGHRSFVFFLSLKESSYGMGCFSSEQIVAQEFYTAMFLSVTLQDLTKVFPASMIAMWKATYFFCPTGPPYLAFPL